MSVAIRPDERPHKQIISFATINNVKDSASLDYTKGEMTDICNFDMSKDSILSRRNGFTQVSAIGAFAGWSSNNGTALYTTNNTIYAYTSGTPLAIASVSGNVCYCDLEDMIAYGSNNGVGFYPSVSLEQPHELDVEFERQWTQPVNALAYWNGRLYVAVGGELQCSKSFKFNVYDYREYKAAVYTSGIIGIYALNNGMYVATSERVYWISGSDPFNDDFRQQIVLNYGVLPGKNGQIIPAGFVKQEQTGKAVIFTTYKGICIGFDGGNCINVSQGNFSYPIGTSCGDIVMERQGANVYIVNINNDNNSPYNAFEEWDMDVNTIEV